MYNFDRKLKHPDQEKRADDHQDDSTKADGGESSKGIFGRVFDMTGEAFEKFGNFFRGESTEKKIHEDSDRLQTVDIKIPCPPNDKRTSSFVDLGSSHSVAIISPLSSTKQNMIQVEFSQKSK